jgi:glycosyl transferase, family 25
MIERLSDRGDNSLIHADLDALLRCDLGEGACESLGAENLPSSIEIVVISLASATKRRRTISYPLAWSFFDAHTSLQNDDLSYDEEEILRHFGQKLSGPQQAVWSSHYTVIKRFLDESPSDYLLVLEDDVIFDTDFPIEQVADLCAEKTIDYLRLYGMYYAKAQQLSFFFDRAIIRYMSSPCGTQAYLLSKAGARKFTDTSRKLDATIDLALDQFWRTGLPIYSIFPFPIIERFSPSSIPILPASATSGRDKLISHLNRLINKVRKIRENARLGRHDAQFRRGGLPFRQIESQDFNRK